MEDLRRLKITKRENVIWVWEKNSFKNTRIFIIRIKYLLHLDQKEYSFYYIKFIASVNLFCGRYPTKLLLKFAANLLKSFSRKQNDLDVFIRISFQGKDLKASHGLILSRFIYIRSIHFSRKYAFD